MKRSPSRGRLVTRASVGSMLALGSVAMHAGCFPPEEACHPRCDGNTKVSCELDTPSREDCGSRTCVEDLRTYEAYAVCAIGGRDQRCNPEIDDVFCDGDKIDSCHGAFVENVDDCGARGLQCALASLTVEGVHRARCVSSLVPDARCAAPSSEDHLFCDGDLLAACFDQFLMRADHPCSAMGQHCVDLPAGGARCE